MWEGGSFGGCIDDFQFAREDSLGSFLVVGGFAPGFQGGDDGIKTERYQGRMADKLERLVYE